MRGREVLATLAAMVLLLVGNPGQAQEPAHITDIAGDANGLDAGDLRPASYDPADLLAVEFRTTYIAVPVGADGFHYEPTGLTFHYRTLGVPQAPAGDLDFRLSFELGGCTLDLDAYLNADGPDESWTILSWTGDPCPPKETSSRFGDFGLESGGWEPRVDTAAKELVVEIPFASVSKSLSEFLRVGAVIRMPRALTALNSLWGTEDTGPTPSPLVLDRTGVGRNFVIGSDVPADVPCTEGCP